MDNKELKRVTGLGGFFLNVTILRLLKNFIKISWGYR